MDKIKQKITNWVESDQVKTILTILIIILVGLGSFELGRLSKTGESSSGLKIEYPAQEASEANPVTASALQVASKTKTIATTSKTSTIYFASKRGHKYYPMTCSAGKDIKMENRIYFDTAAQAQAAGYELSTGCK